MMKVSQMNIKLKNYQYNQVISLLLHLSTENSNDLQSLVDKLIKSLSMMPIESTEIVTSQAHHVLKLYGKSIKGDKVASVIRLASNSKGFMMKNQVKSSNEEISAMVANYIE
ncbi:unnamed protein product [[Candida] boidinii]|nr:unnamed protein product [[Candida] boidinii]